MLLSDEPLQREASGLGKCLVAVEDKQVAANASQSSWPPLLARISMMLHEPPKGLCFISYKGKPLIVLRQPHLNCELPVNNRVHRVFPGVLGSTIQSLRELIMQ